MYFDDPMYSVTKIQYPSVVPLLLVCSHTCMYNIYLLLQGLVFYPVAGEWPLEFSHHSEPDEHSNTHWTMKKANTLGGIWNKKSRLSKYVGMLANFLQYCFQSLVLEATLPSHGLCHPFFLEFDSHHQCLCKRSLG